MSETTELREIVAKLTEGLTPGPFHVAGRLNADGGDCEWWLDNEAGDSSFPDGDDVAAMVNALPALLDVVDAARELIAQHFTAAHMDSASGTDIGSRLSAALDRLAASDPGGEQ